MAARLIPITITRPTTITPTITIPPMSDRNRSAHTATTSITRMPARRMVIMGPHTLLTACLSGSVPGIRATPEAATTVVADITVATAETTIATKEMEAIAAAMEVATREATAETTIDTEAEATAAATRAVMDSVAMADSTLAITAFVGDITAGAFTAARDFAAIATTVVDFTGAKDSAATGTTTAVFMAVTGSGAVATTVVALTAVADSMVAVVITATVDTMAMADITGTAAITTAAGNGFFGSEFWGNPTLFSLVSGLSRTLSAQNCSPAPALESEVWRSLHRI